MNNIGTMSIGLKAPIIKKGDDINKIVIDTLAGIDNEFLAINDGDIVCITESIVARAQGNYVTINDIVQFLSKNQFKKKLVLYSPIMSRNRFSLILKAFARYAKEIIIVFNGDKDEQGNPNYGINVFTGINIQEFYKEICLKEDCKISFHNNLQYIFTENKDVTFIDCRCHPCNEGSMINLLQIMNTPINENSGWSEYGLLGSNKADEETLKLFPRGSFIICNKIKEEIKKVYNKEVEILIYGDGCFKDPIGGIWEFADPVTCPGFTDGLKGTPNEIKLKALADGKYNHLSGKILKNAIENEILNKKENLYGKMVSQGTTPRRYIDLLASLADLTSGSGDKGTPIILIKNYFKNYAQ